MLGVSLFAMTFSFSATAQTCKPVPTCAELGYTETSCTGDSLKCPFDTSKMYCLPVVPHSCNSSETKVGDIYYSDDTCSSEAISGKTPIGIVFDTDRKLVAALTDPHMHWNDGSETSNDIPSLTNYGSGPNPKQDFNGKSNTDAIVAYAASSGQAHEAAQFCHNMTTGGKTWYLPALGEMLTLPASRETINEAMERIGVDGLSVTGYWSSTEYYKGNDGYAYEYNSGGLSPMANLRYAMARTLCIFSYK